MSNPFSSAKNYFSGGGGERGSRFLGQTVDLGGNRKLKVKKVIAEGGYGYVFVAQDTETGRDYALKRQVVAKENIKIVKKEIAFLKQLGDHPHIINYVASAGIPPSETSHGNAEFLIQTELCDGGKMEDVLRSSHLSPKQVLRVFYATCSAVAHMHSLQPPIVHRDLKAENLLLDSDGVIKLCDFGSATTQQLNPDSSWTAVQRGLTEDEIQCNTTPMYRSPEMVDLYSNRLISEKADIWALGCLLYLLCFRTHPFEDSSKLGIINANYKIPQEDTTFTIFHPIIRSCLVVEPGQRPSVDALLAKLYSLSDQLGENMEAPSVDLLLSAREASENSHEGDSEGGTVTSALQSTSHQAQKLFGFMKDGAGSLFKNIKESSSKAINAMAASGPKRSGLDIVYITSRILAMSYPHDDAFHGHHMTEVRTFLDEHHPSAYLVFNLSGNSYDVSKLNNQVYDFAWPQRGVPDMEKLVDLCRSMDAWLRADKQNVLVVHCHDGVSITPVAIVSYLLFVQALSSPKVGLKYVAVKRKPEAPVLAGTPSQLRYLQHMASLVGQSPYKPHPHKMMLTMLRLSTVPLFNAIRTGCKPFVEVYQQGERIYTSASNETMDSIRSFHSEDGSVAVPLGITVQGNFAINVYHVRAIPVARKAGMGMTAVKMFFLNLHTGFLDSRNSHFKFDRKNLDGSSVRKQDKFPSPFHATLEVEWDRSAGEGVYNQASWQNLPYPKSSPLSCFSTLTEEEEVIKQLDPRRDTQTLPEIPTTPTTPSSDIIHPHTNPASMQEETTSAGGGTLLSLGNSSPSLPPASNGSSDQMGRDFFSQLDWQERQKNAQSAGYVPYQDRASDSGSSSGDSSGSDSSEDEFNQFQVAGSHAPHASSGNGVSTRLDEGLLIGNFVSSSNSDDSGEGQSAPQIKLIEFGGGGEQSGDQLAPPPSHPTPYVDPFQEGVAPNKTSTGDLSGVVFDPFGGLSETAPAAQNADSAFGGPIPAAQNADPAFSNLLGLDSGHLSPSHSGLQPNLQDSSMGGKVGVSSESSGGDLFDPFGSSSTRSDHSLLSTGSTLLAPMNLPPSAHRHSEPSIKQYGQMLAPSTSDPVTQSRKLSSPAPFDHRKPPTNTTSTYAAPSTLHTHPYSNNVSLSQPNLSFFGNSQRPTHSQSGGSVSHNSSPHRSPSPAQQQGMQFGSTGNLTQKQPAQFDPFSQFDLSSVSGKTTAAAAAGSGNARPSSATTQHSKPPTGNSYQPYYMQSQANSRNGMQQSGSQTKPPESARMGSKPKVGSAFNARPQSPNYNASLFSSVGNKTGIPSKPKENAFGDLLGAANFAPKSSNESKTLKDLKSKDAITNALDPDRAKVAAWADRKERNIRAIISSLHEILWEGETRWNEVGMHQLVQPDQVKKFYRQACLSVHPDKTQDTGHEKLARAIFDELNDAYAKFEESGARPLY